MLCRIPTPWSNGTNPPSLDPSVTVNSLSTSTLHLFTSPVLSPPHSPLLTLVFTDQVTIRLHHQSLVIIINFDCIDLLSFDGHSVLTASCPDCPNCLPQNEATLNFSIPIFSEYTILSTTFMDHFSFEIFPDQLCTMLNTACLPRCGGFVERAI